jgi:hypothetical protein
MVKKKKEETTFLGLNKEELTKKNFVEGAIIRPAIQMLAFVTFIIGIFFILIQNYQWGGSMIIFSFVLNLGSIYKSLSDEASIFRSMNLGFKLVMFLAEVMIFNFILLNL